MLDYRFEYRYVRPSLKADLMTSISCRSEPRVNIAIINWPQSREERIPFMCSQFTEGAASTKYECLQCHTLFPQILSQAATLVSIRHIYLSTFLEHLQQDQTLKASLTAAGL